MCDIQHWLILLLGAGSPYTLKISGAPDASKVRVRGPGIEHGILATYKSQFICETKGAGPGQLTVRVRGPKGESESGWSECADRKVKSSRFSECVKPTGIVYIRVVLNMSAR